MIDPIDHSLAATVSSMALSLNTHVELLDRYADVYAASVTGARGWVRGKREFPQRDPEVFIEWDRTHWRYHGEADGWTFEHHFTEVTDEVAHVELPEHSLLLGPTLGQSNVEFVPPSVKQFLDTLKDIMANDVADNDDPEEPTPSIDEMMDAIANCDAFVVITVTAAKEDGVTVYEPDIFHDDISESARKVLEAQIVDLATGFFQESVLESIDRLSEDDE